MPQDASVVQPMLAFGKHPAAASDGSVQPGCSQRHAVSAAQLVGFA